MSNDQMTKDGNIEISEAVLMTFVEKTVGEFEGIYLSRRRKTIKITRSEAGAVIDLGLDVKYGTNIPETVRKLQFEIKERITNLAGINVIEVNVVVEGLNIEDLIKK